LLRGRRQSAGHGGSPEPDTPFLNSGVDRSISPEETQSAVRLAFTSEGRCRQPSIRHRDHHVSYSLGAAFAQLGERARAIDSLRVAADTGFHCAIWYATDPLLQPLRADPLFAALQEDLAARRDAAAGKHGQPSALRRD
jgi:hypothetical protein